MISSAHNAVFRRWLAAREKPDRRTGELLLEGFHLSEAWTLRHGPPEALMVAQDYRPAADEQVWLQRHPVPIERLSAPLFAKLSTLEAFAGPIALVRPKARLSRQPDPARGDLVYLERVQDPGNLGTMLRSCAAFGVRQVALSPGTAWPWSPKALRSGMSAQFHLDCFDDFSHEELSALSGFQRLATSGQSEAGSRALDQLDLRAPALWCMGNEGAGLSAAVLGLPGTQRVFIPQSPAVESLNVAAALAVCLFEQQRQRRVAGG